MVKKRGKTRKKATEKEKKPSKIKVFIDKTKSDIKGFFLSFDFIHFNVFQVKDRKVLKKIRAKNSHFAVENLIKGLGGEKNLLKVKNTIYGLTVKFKSEYLLDREFLEKSGGLDIRIVDKFLFSVFDKRETGRIAKELKRRIKDCKRKYKPLDIE